MGEGRAAGGGEESDLFDLWVAHRDGASEQQVRPTTVPPAWAPTVRSATEPAGAPTVDREPELRAAAEPTTEPEPEPEPEPQPVEAIAEPAPVASFASRLSTLVESAPTAQATPTAQHPGHRQTPVAGPADPGEPALDTDTRDDLAPVATPVTTDAPHRGGRRTEEPPPPLRHTFSPRTRARTAVAIGTLLAAGAAVVGCYVAAREKDAASIGIAVTLWVLTGIIWAVHSGTSVTRLSVRGGQLDVLRHGVRTTFDLTSTYTPVEVYGRPGRAGWKVVFRRRDLSGFVIDHTMVDPTEFMRVLRYYRPGIEPGIEPVAAGPEAG